MARSDVSGSGRAGEFDERVLQGLDWVVAEAKRRRLLLLPCLLNYWDDYGGALWSEQRGAVCWRYQPRPSISANAPLAGCHKASVAVLLRF